MATITKLVPGQIVYSVIKKQVFKVKIISIDLQANSVVVSFNNNPPSTRHAKAIKQWKVKEPKSK